MMRSDTTAKALRPSLPEPVRYRDADGVERLYGRRPSLNIAGRFYCPRGHRIHDVRLGLEEDTYKCNHGGDHRRTGCGVLLYVIAFLPVRGTHEMLWAVEVTAGEIERMRRMDLPDKLEYLETSWVGVG